MAVGGMDAVDLVVAGHDGTGMRGAHTQFKPQKIDFAQRALGDHGGHTAAVFFLVVAGEVFDGHSASFRCLNALGEGCGHAAREQRIFREILEISSAQRIAVDIHARGQPELHMQFLHFRGNQAADLADARGIKGLGEQRADGHGGGKLIPVDHAVLQELFSEETVFKLLHAGKRHERQGLRVILQVLLQAESRRTVSHDRAADAEGVFKHRRSLPGGTGCTDARIPDEFGRPLLHAADTEHGFLFLGELREDFLRSGVEDVLFHRHGSELRTDSIKLGLERQCRELLLGGLRVEHGLPCAERLRIREDGFQGILQGKDIPGPVQEDGLLQRQASHRGCRIGGGAQQQGITACIQIPGGFSGVEGSEQAERSLQEQGFRCAGCQFSGLGKGDEALVLFGTKPAGAGSVQLKDLASGAAAGIGDADRNAGHAVSDLNAFRLFLKGGQGQTVAEGIPGLNGKRVKKAVADIDILGIVFADDIAVVVTEVGTAGQVFIVHGPGIGEMP